MEEAKTILQKYAQANNTINVKDALRAMEEYKSKILGENLGEWVTELNMSGEFTKCLTCKKRWREDPD